MKNKKCLPILVAMAALLLGSVSATRSQTTNGNCRYFAETGHYVCDAFLNFFETRGGVEIFGYPLTETFYDSARGVQVQYFQRARLEWRPWNPDPYKVQLGLLVDELGYVYPPARPEQIPALNSAIHHYFPETDHVVSYAFLQYFREKGGLDIFGYPRSEFMYENGYIVQYFQRARVEWHPEAVDGPQMRLTNLAEKYIERFEVPEAYKEPQPPPSSGPGAPPPPVEFSVTKLDTSATVRHAITGRRGVQTIFVYVNDQRQNPIQNASARAVIHYQSGDQTCTFEPTNASGFTRCGFEILSSPPGQKVVIDVIVTYGEWTATTQTFFLPWW